MSNRLNIYSFFHLNLMFSSISEDQRPEVVQRCYWPLLRLIRQNDLPIGIEASGYTLETIAAIDPAWIKELRDLCCNGPAEFIGSGYAQLIGPLVPGEVNRANQRIGLQIYEKILGFRPKLVLVNEQAYSAGLVAHYHEAGYQGMVMEWDNPARFSPDWCSQWRYLPQMAVGTGGEELPVIWNNSIFFQQFQRYVHGDLELPEYLDMLGKQVAAGPRVIPLYGNDVEIFDFRPGRFTTEAVIEHDEWNRIRLLLLKLAVDERFSFIKPSSVLDFLSADGAGNRLKLESAQAPIPVKKQEKYNITRWAVTGRNDLQVNTLCYRYYKRLMTLDGEGEHEWKELCYLWSSDFRTHITTKRWRKYQRRLKSFTKKMTPNLPLTLMYNGEAAPVPETVQVKREGNFLRIETEQVALILNLRRGMAIDSLVFGDVATASLCGTLYHGFFDDIASAADFYTGHFVFETQGRPKITDLVSVAFDVKWVDVAGELVVSAQVDTPLGRVEKQISLNPFTKSVTLDYLFHWPRFPVGSLRLGHVTVNPNVFNSEELYFSSHNGGSRPERFAIQGNPIFHGEPSSFLVSAKQGLGLTEGVVEIGDSEKAVKIEIDRALSSLIGLITYKAVGQSYFLRCSFSASEMDETSRSKKCTEPLRARLTLSAMKHG